MILMGSYAAILVAWLVALLINAQVTTPLLQVKEGFSVFAALYIATQALERLLEPLANYFTPQDVQDIKSTSAELRSAADKTRLKKSSGARAVVFWTIASVAGLLLSAALGLYVIQAVAEVRTGADGELPTLLKPIDILLTGLIVGAGTKPLHDLIGNLEKKKEDSGS